jgi:hypothetical protein
MLRQFSNPDEVKKKARYYNLNQVYESTHHGTYFGKLFKYNPKIDIKSNLFYM